MPPRRASHGPTGRFFSQSKHRCQDGSGRFLDLVRDSWDEAQAYVSRSLVVS